MPVNLSCGNCNAIRPFSGQPPACDKCGWVYAPEPSGRIAPGVDAIKEIVSTAGKVLAPLRWLIGILLAFAGVVFFIWVLISGIHWFWDHPLW